MNSDDIIQTAMSFYNYKYWYGGSGEIATLELADQLRNDYPRFWTESYYNKAILDINGINRVADCSWLVSECYELGYHCSTAEMPDVFMQWYDSPADGMIAWRQGHAGIYSNGTVIAMRSLDLDFGITEYRSSDWSRIYYDPFVDYSDLPPDPPEPPSGNSFPGWLYVILKAGTNRR